MGWTGSAPNQTFQRTDGTRTGTTVWQEADSAGVDIVPDDHDTHDQDIATGLNLALKKDGGNTATADIPMGGNKFTNLGNAENTDEAITFVQAQQSKHKYYPTVGGTANAITLTGAGSLTSGTLVAGQEISFIAGSNNTGATTVAVDGGSAITVKRFDGSTDLVEDDIRSGMLVLMQYDGTNLQLVSAPTQTSASADILARTVPTGATMFWGLDTIPAGWLKCEGQSVLKADYPELDSVYSADSYPYGSDATTFNLPPAAGRFIRILDAAAGVDPDAGSRTDRGDGTTGDNVGTIQGDDYKSHTHTGTTDGHEHFVKWGQNTSGDTGSATTHMSGIDTNAGQGGSGDAKTETATDNFTTAASPTSGGNETRPKNIYQYLIILANPTAASAANVGLFGLPYNFDTATADADPGSGNLRLDNATLASATNIYLDNLEANGADVSAAIDVWDDSDSTVQGYVTITKVGAPANFAIYSVTGAVTDGTGYRKVAVTHVDSAGSFSSGDSISVEFVRTGDKGDSGDVGFLYAFDSSTTTTSDPGTGDVRLNNATLASVTEIAVSDQTNGTGNPDISGFLLTWDDSDSAVRGTITIQKTTARENFAIYDVTGASTNESGWVRLTVTHVDSAGSFSNTDAINVSFVRTGDKGTPGGVRWAWDTSTSMADPGTGDLRLDNATLSSVTNMAISASSGETGNPDLSDWVASWDDIGNAGANGQLTIKKISAPENFAIYNVGSVTDNTTWLQVGLTYLDHAGSFSASDDLSVEFAPAGADGAGTGDVTAASNFGTDNVLIRADGTGKGVQSSGIDIDDSDNVSGVGTLDTTGKISPTIDDATNNDVTQALKVGHTTSGTPANGIGVGIEFEAETAAGNNEVGATITAVADDTTATSEDFSLNFNLMIAGAAAAKVLGLTGTALSPGSDDGQALGTTALGWADLFLASGGVVNFNNGDITVTHSAGSLAFAGATATFTFDDEITPASNDGAALGTATVSWSDLFLASGAVINFNNGDVTLTHSSNQLALGGGNLDLQDNELVRPLLKDYGEEVNDIGSTGGGTQDIDLTLGNVVTATVDTSSNTFTFSNPTASGDACSFTLVLTNGGSQTVNWPASVDWAGGTAPTLTSAGVDVLEFFTEDGGTTWYGFAAGLDMQ